MYRDHDSAGCAIATLLFFVTCVAAWGTHIIVCLRDGEWGFLIAGALFFPVAIVHGVGCWFGAW